MVPLVPFANHRRVHTYLLRLHECVVLHFLVRSSTSEWNICTSRVFTGCEDRHRLATLWTGHPSAIDSSGSMGHHHTKVFSTKLHVVDGSEENENVEDDGVLHGPV